MDASRRRLLRSIPAVDELLARSEARDLMARYSREVVRDALGLALDEYRDGVISCAQDEPFEADHRGYWARVQRAISRWTNPGPFRVINATGVVLHTNLGRAPLSKRAMRHVSLVAEGYSDLEYDLPGGSRGTRDEYSRELLRRLTGAEDALVVNNNAAAILLVLNTFARGLEVVVSRGELVEIGGSFRIPEVLRSGGAVPVEVGTTNRTHPSDYLDAIGDATAALMKIHRSNFSIRGFVAEVSPDDLASMAEEAGVLSVFDLGSGYLAAADSDLLRGETAVSEAVKSGMDLVTFSGDKLLGGPQAGIILGKRDLLDKLRANQMLRALRVDKMTFAALNSTLASYVEGSELIDIPALRMIAEESERLGERAERMASELRSIFPGGVETMPGYSRIGGGSSPGTDLPTHLVICTPETGEIQDWLSNLRCGNTPVVARAAHGGICFDVRTILPGDVSDLLRSVGDIARSVEGGITDVREG